MTRMNTRLAKHSASVSQNRGNGTAKEGPVRCTRRQGAKSVGLSDSSDDDDLHFTTLTKPKAAFSTPRKEKSRTTDSELNELSPTTPPKQNKLQETLTSFTRTPSSLLKKLVLTSPRAENARSNRKKLFKENNGKIPDKTKVLNKQNHCTEGDIIVNTDHTFNREPRTSIYQNARRALHSTLPRDMPGRENELDQLEQFIKDHMNNKTSGSLYVSGPPGTGKTASLNMILQEESIASNFRQVYVNCTAIKSPTAIYSRIVKELEIKVSGKSEKDYLTGLENFLKKKHKMILLVLDEIDQLESKNQSILYTIFEWPSKPNSQIILIGIANALDLTDRTLPRLQARCELKPKLMHFAPYSKQQIVQIFTSRLKEAGVLEVFSPAALQMLAGKVAAVSGDVRRALDIGRRVIELVDQSKNETTLKPIENLASELIDNETKTVDLKQVLSILNNVYGTSQNLTEETESSFPLQQKIIICSLILMLKKAKNKNITIGQLHEVYRRVCTKRNLLAVDQAEFVGLCSLIETRGIIRVSGKKEPRLHKVSLEWDEEEVAASLKDKQLMSVILQDESCLGKL